MKSIPLTRLVIGAEEIEAVRVPLESGWLVQGPLVEKFEAMTARYCRVPYAVATSSCTAALHISLLACGLKPGDRVIVPSFTYVATANAVEHADGIPLFADIDLNTFNISADSSISIIIGCQQRGVPIPKAIVPVHLFGLCAEIEPILKLSEDFALNVVEDAACALGSTIGDTHAGDFGDVGCFSFHPRKVITTGEGGMAVTSDKRIADMLRMLRDHGAQTSDFSRHGKNAFDLPGYNYRMTDLQGALGTIQMERLPELIRSRKNSI